MKYKEFILLESMDFNKALKLLNLSGNFSEADLKKAYRQASMKAHPDRGGSTDDMQLVNAAYEFLKKSSVTSSGPINLSAEKDMAEQLLKTLDTRKYEDHFQKIFNDTLRVSSDRTTANNSYVTRIVTFHNSNREIMVEITFFANLANFIKAKGALSPSRDVIPSISISFETLYNRKKVKVNKQDYKIERNANVFTDPEILFPAKKIGKKIGIIDSKAGAGDSSKHNTVKKSDFFATLKGKLNLKVAKPDVIQLEAGDYIIQGERMTMMRLGFWNFNLYKKKSSFMLSLPSMIYETDKYLDLAVIWLDKIQKASNVEAEWAKFSKEIERLPY